MHVNHAPHKTCAVVFRAVSQGVIAEAPLLFDGQAVPMQESYTYLGLPVHAKQGFVPASEALAASGTRALYAMMGGACAGATCISLISGARCLTYW
jgi:hypothetical protein